MPEQRFDTQVPLAAEDAAVNYRRYQIKARSAAMTQQAAENRSWLVAKLQERGIYDEVRAKAMAIVFGSIEYEVTWQKAFALAYADGHNVRHLGGKRLGHYASAYADLCEEAGAVLVPDAFFQAWDEGAVFEGTETGHWHYA